MSHHDLLEYGIPVSSLCDQRVLTLLAESRWLQIFKMLLSGVSSKILYLEIWGNIWSIPAASFYVPSPNYCVEMVFCEIWHPNSPQDAHRKDCCKELACLWQLPPSELCHCSLPLRQGLANAPSTFFMWVVIWGWKYGLAMSLARIKRSLRNVA